LARILGALFLVTFIVSVVSSAFGTALARNWAALGLFKALVVEPSDLPNAEHKLINSSQKDCRSFWLLGLASQTLNQQAKRDQSWEASLYCSPEYVPLLSLIAPQHRDWAQTSVDTYPQVAASWFWLAYTYLDPSDPGFSRPWIEQDLAQIIPYYKKALNLTPYNGKAWRELGDLLSKIDPIAAIEAYLNSCYNGDPGSNGCYRAGTTAEKLGDYQNAIVYYRMSRWSGAHEKADQLENLK
jgi:tetratricopeptide (TPR) repeat protein